MSTGSGCNKQFQTTIIANVKMMECYATLSFRSLSVMACRCANWSTTFIERLTILASDSSNKIREKDVRHECGPLLKGEPCFSHLESLESCYVNERSSTANSKGALSCFPADPLAGVLLGFIPFRSVYSLVINHTNFYFSLSIYIPLVLAPSLSLFSVCLSALSLVLVFFVALSFVLVLAVLLCHFH